MKNCPHCGEELPKATRKAKVKAVGLDSIAGELTYKQFEARVKNDMRLTFPGVEFTYSKTKGGVVVAWVDGPSYWNVYWRMPCYKTLSFVDGQRIEPNVDGPPDCRFGLVLKREQSDEQRLAFMPKTSEFTMFSDYYAAEWTALVAFDSVNVDDAAAEVAA